MSETKVFHTFKHEGRTITLCAKVNFKPIEKPEDVTVSDVLVRVGHAVCMAGDTFKEELGRTISEGRADSDNRMISLPVSAPFVTRGLLKQILKDAEARIKKGILLTIKGIR